MADNSPILIRKVVEEGGHGHHGGAWKVAYADFVTAMMAFFLMLWLLATADQEQLKGLAEYFSDAKENVGRPGGVGGVLQGVSIVNDDMTLQLPTSPFAPSSLPLTATLQEIDTDAFTLDLAAQLTPDGSDAAIEITEDSFEAERERRERAAFEETKAGLLDALSEAPELISFTDSLIIDQTPEGLRIQIIDREQSAMFASGSASLFPTAVRLLELVARSLAGLPNRLSIRGHTDARPFSAGADYDNWRLSSDRANATREALVAAGIAQARIANVMGKADSEPLFPEDPMDARNRRMSLVMLRETGTTLGPTSSTSPRGEVDQSRPDDGAADAFDLPFDGAGIDGDTAPDGKLPGASTAGGPR
jgi:chemotaxis protein MotB